ncbi:MAG: hypothetical protein LBB21_04315 [Holosporaceae bacterium]|nr:hypothetical protein [Holosporaceae bacterium]
MENTKKSTLSKSEWYVHIYDIENNNVSDSELIYLSMMFRSLLPKLAGCLVMESKHNVADFYNAKAKNCAEYKLAVKKEDRMESGAEYDHWSGTFECAGKSLKIWAILSPEWPE